MCIKDVVEGKEGLEGGDGAKDAKSKEHVNKQTMRDFLLIEKGELESWRCILPTGTVIRYKNNGNAQVNLFSIFHKQ